MKSINRKAQSSGSIGVVFMFLFFIINWFVWAGKMINEAGALAITSGGATGIEAFFYDYLNLFVLIALILGLMAAITFGGGD